MRSGSALATFGAIAMLAVASQALAQSAPPLRSAASFVVLGNSSVTNTGASRVTGNVGVSPGDVVTGFSSGMFQVGDIRRDDALARQARIDSDAAADNLFAQPCVVLGDADLGGKVLGGGVYCFTAADVRLSGTLILDAAEEDRDAVWIFRIAGTLTTTSDATVLVIGDGCDGNVFWWTGGATTLAERTTFIGNIFARTNITLADGASLSGRAFARTGSVTLQASKVSLCCAPLLLAPAGLPDGVLGMPYRQTVTASGGMSPYTFAISSGSLPFGLVLASDGTLAGTPATYGPFAFTVTATDALGCSSTAAYSIRIDCGVRTTIPPTTVGADYSFPLIFDGIPPFTCSIAAGALPLGLSLDGCVIDGAPDELGTFDFVVESRDALGVRRSRCMTIDVSACPIALLPPDPPTGTACEPYLHTFGATGGTAPYVFTAPAAALPPGWVLSPTTGVLSGTTPLAGTYIVPLTVTDALSSSCSRRVTISVSCPPAEGTAVILPRGIVGVPYSETIPEPVCGGPATISVVSGEEPPGLDVMTSGIVSGTPTKAGVYSFVVASRTTDGCTTTHKVTIDIDCPRLVVSPAALPGGTVGVAYPEINFSVIGGTAPYSFTDSGSLPDGLALSIGGTLFGTPTTAGTFVFDIFVTDANGCSTVLTFCGIDVGAASCPAGTFITLSPPGLPAAAPNALYTQAITASGGTAPYTFSVTTGLPSGLTLDPMTGILSGIPTETGLFSFTITATDANGCRGSFCYLLGVGVAIPTMSSWMLFAVSILLAGAGWIVIGRR